MNSRPEPDILSDYMDRLRGRLRKLPEEQSAEMVREIREHMQDLVADYVAAGATPEEAVRRAETKFGSAEKVGQRLMWEQYGKRELLTWAFSFVWVPVSLVFFEDTIFDWKRLAVEAALGAGFGVFLALAPQQKRPKFKWPVEAVDWWMSSVSIAILITFSVLTFVYMSWSWKEELFADMTAIFGSAAASYFLTKALRKRLRGARL